MSDTTEQTIVATFKRAALEIDGKHLETVPLDQKISELGIDSVAMMEIVGFIEDELGVHLADETLNRVQTVRDLVAAVQSA